jgi:HlyD family secretion protein
MTANLMITIDERNDVLKVPNAALRFTPQRSGNASGQNQGQGQGAQRRQRQQQGETAGGGNAGNSSERANFAPASAPVLEGQTRIVWVLGQDGKPERRRIKVGLSDGASTEVVEGELKEGDMVITGQTLSGSTSSQNNQSRPPGFGNAPRVGGGGGRGR